ncbi:MAG: hypothetical protein K9J17_07925, partial [Flavobacteriales bacterium]|nr:hypothetical protein [Flavobacteriales bacterium]
MVLSSINILLLALSVGENDVFHVYGFVYFYIDKLSWFFALLINVMWLITVIYSHSFSAYHFQNKTRKFYVFFNLVVSVLLMNVFAGNTLTMFLFYVLG